MLTNTSNFQIESRFNGPPKSGNGGCVCGFCAAPLLGFGPGALDSPAPAVQVRYKSPAPLETNLGIVTGQDKAGARTATITQEDGSNPAVKVAEAKALPGPLKLEVPQPVDWTTASRAAEKCIGFEMHAFPTCFVCGTDRTEGDGLRIFPGAAPQQAGFDNLVWAPWKMYDSFVADDGLAQPVIVWAALDCPGFFAAALETPILMVLAGMSAQIIRRPTASENCIAAGWEIKRQSRSVTVGTAIYSAQSGELLAKAEGKWLAPKNWDADNVVQPA